MTTPATPRRSAPKRLLSRLSPVPWFMLVQFRHELRMLRLRLSWRLNPFLIWRRHRLHGLRALNIDVACGRRHFPGWVNVDAYAFPGVDLVFDVRARWPFADGSVDMIFCEHFLVMLDYDEEIPRFLRECHRVLAPGGVIRIVSGNIARYFREYLDQGPLPAEGQVIQWFGSKGELMPSVASDACKGRAHGTRLELINAVMRMYGNHRSAFDPETAEVALRAAGFTTVIHQAFGVSLRAGLALDSPDRKIESFYVEAVKD